MQRMTLLAFTGLLAAALGLSGCESMQSMPLLGKSDAGWTTLLDGAQGLENWNRVGSANWAVVDGVVTADRSDKGAGFLVSKNSYKDFVVRAEFWVTDNANSGIFMRCKDAKNVGDETCYEANIFDQRPDPTYRTGAIVGVAKPSVAIDTGNRWNDYDIVARGRHLVVKLNGQTTVDVEDDKLVVGPIGLQYAAGQVKFRHVRIRGY